MGKIIVPLVALALSAAVALGEEPSECPTCGKTVSPPEKKPVKPPPPAKAPVKPFGHVMVKHHVRVTAQNGTAYRYIAKDVILVCVPGRVRLNTPEYMQRMALTKAQITLEHGPTIPIKGSHPIKGYFWITPI